MADRAAARRARPVLVYNGDCGFCAGCVRLAERRIGTRAEAVPYQFADLAALGVPRERAEREVVWVARDGRTQGGAQAVGALLRDAGGAWWPVGAALRIPPLRWAAHGIYRLIAVNRSRLPGGTPACAIPPDHPDRRPSVPAD